MRRSKLVVLAGCLAAAVIFTAVVLAKSLAPDAGIAPHPFRTGVYLDRPEDFDAEANTVLAHVSASGATIVRLTFYWAQVAPATEPSSWNPANPADPHYDWTKYDREIERAHAHHLDVLLTFLAAPTWAQTPPAGTDPLSSHLPSVADYRAFVTAAAKRYSGGFDHLPRVRYWQAWNEPNISPYLDPQLTAGKPVAVYDYREMLNAFYAAVKAVHPDNLVIAAGLAPFRDITGAVMAQNKDWGPLAFMRYLLCIGADLKPTCSTKVSFDAWAQHPYTSGDPTHHAVLANDVSLGDIPKVQRILAAAEAAGHVRSAGGKPRFWVTEFSWDTSPPDPYAVPAALAARWVAQTAYVLWKDGVDELTWLMIRDDSSSLQSGLYYHGSSVAADRPKPLFEAFRFPVVGFRRAGHVEVWGRTPAGKPSSVVIQRQVGSTWRRVGTLQSDQYGIFRHEFANVAGSAVRAVLPTGEASRGFLLRKVPDHFYNPFGGPTSLETSKPKSKPKGG